MKITIIALLGAAIGFLCGCFAAIVWINRIHLIFEPKLTCGDVLTSSSTLVAAVIVTVLVTYYVEKHNQTERTEKDLLLRQFDLILPVLQEFEKANEGGNLGEIQAGLKRFNVSCNCINNMLKRLKYPNYILKDSDFSELVSDLRKLSTDTPIKTIEKHAEQCEAVVRDGIISLAADRRARLEGKIVEAKLKILQLQVAINRK